MTGVTTQRRLIVVPVKDPSQSKTRLAPELKPQQREALARELFERTLAILNRAKKAIGAEHIDLAVVTSSAEMTDLARQKAVQTIREPVPASLNGALQHAAVWAVDHGYHSMCVLPADLARPDLLELKQLLTYPLAADEVVLCPADDLGTNALLLNLPHQIGFQYGSRSFLQHFNAAEQCGLKPILLPLSSLKYDVDTSQDLASLLAQTPELSRRLQEI